MNNHTPGPWQWFVREDGVVYLGTPNRGRLIVMDCVRKGTRFAVPRFAHWDGMTEGKPRERLGGIMSEASDDVAAHPDARLIAAAPEMYRLLRYLQDHSNAKALLSEGFIEDMGVVLAAADGGSKP